MRFSFFLPLLLTVFLSGPALAATEELVLPDFAAIAPNIPSECARSDNVADANSCQRLDHGALNLLFQERGLCRWLDNTHGSHDYFIPYNSGPELDAFLNHSPSGVAVDTCCLSSRTLVGQLADGRDVAVTTPIGRVYHSGSGALSNIHKQYNFDVEKKSCAANPDGTETCNTCNVIQTVDVVANCAGAGWNVQAIFSTPTCEVPAAGVCGSANGVGSANAPTDGLCSTGTASAVTSTGSGWAWTCAGSGGGAAASCAAPTEAGLSCVTGMQSFSSPGVYVLALDNNCPHNTVTFHVQLWGAGGGSVTDTSVSPPWVAAGGKGGFTQGDVTIASGQTLTVIVGSAGSEGGTSSIGGGGIGGAAPNGSMCISYYSNGGTGVTPPGPISVSSCSASGGGRSAIQYNGSELIDAGAGGGASYGWPGGNGGGSTGEYSAECAAETFIPAYWCPYWMGNGGTQINGGAHAHNDDLSIPGPYGMTDGSHLQGGNGTSTTWNLTTGGGGGGGWYGGGGGSSMASAETVSMGTSGGGGSGYCGGMGVSNCTTTTGTGSAADTNGKVVISW